MCNSYFLFLEWNSHPFCPSHSQFELLMKEFDLLVLEVTLVCWFMLLLLWLCLELVVWFFFSWYEILSNIVPKMSYYGDTGIFHGSIWISLDWKCYFPLGHGWTFVLEPLEFPWSGSRGHTFHCVVVGIIPWDNLLLSAPLLVESWFRIESDDCKFIFGLHCVYGWVERSITDFGCVLYLMFT